MGVPDSNASPLRAAAGAAGPRATEAFSILGDETRLSILLALWEAYEPWDAETAVPFSELRERVGRPDSGQFNYHLEKLTGQFIRRTEEGYELRHAGHHLVRTVIAGAGFGDLSFDPIEVDLDCYLCGAPTAVTYRDEVLYWVCTACEGLKRSDDSPAGTLAAGAFEPAGFAGRTPEELLNAAWTGGLLQFGLGGVCDACSGPMDRWLHVCEDHADEGICPTCGWRYAAVTRFRCSVCKRHHQMAPFWLVVDHPAVVAFYYERGVPLQYEDGVSFQPKIESNLQAHHEQELVSREPPRVLVTIRYEGDELRLTLDGELNVVDVRGPT